jgi:REP element-mobilizing transposase RayT
MRRWLLSNTMYGTWLPGDRRGSVTSVRDFRLGDPQDSDFRFEHDIPGEPWEPEMPGLNRAAKNQMNGAPIYFNAEHAEMVWAQFLETAKHRSWIVHALAIMRDHFHLVVQVPSDPDPKKVLADFKAYASRVLNRRFGVPASETWWTSKGSKRKLADDSYFANAVNYVLFKQPRPLVVWSAEKGRLI